MLGGFGNPVGDKWMHMVFRHWPTKVEWLWTRRPGVCSSVLLILLVPFAWSRNGLGECVQEHTVATLQVGQNTWIELPPAVWKWKGPHAIVLISILKPRTFPKFLESSYSSPAFSIRSLSHLLYRGNLV